MPKIITRANKDAINWCECDETIAGYPGQMDCPWCGCGWLFSCYQCRKAFTFGEVVERDVDLSKLAEADLKSRGMTPTPLLKAEWGNYFIKELKSIASGTEVIYFDGRILPVDKAPVRFKGWHAKHSMKALPHADRDGAALDVVLGDADYWRVREHPDR